MLADVRADVQKATLPDKAPGGWAIELEFASNAVAENGKRAMFGSVGHHPPILESRRSGGGREEQGGRRAEGRCQGVDGAERRQRQVGESGGQG